MDSQNQSGLDSILDITIVFFSMAFVSSKTPGSRLKTPVLPRGNPLNGPAGQNVLSFRQCSDDCWRGAGYLHLQDGTAPFGRFDVHDPSQQSHSLANSDQAEVFIDGKGCQVGGRGQSLAIVLQAHQQVRRRGMLQGETHM